MSSRWSFVIACMLSGMAGGGFAVWLTHGVVAQQAIAQDRSPRVSGLLDSPVERARPQVARSFDAEGLTPEETVNVAVYESVNRSVVNITAKASERMLLMELASEGSGSGAVIDKYGHVLTNNHVVADAKEVAVTLYNGETYDAELVGADPVNDLAVIKIDAPEEELFPLSLGDSRQLKVGMRVFALGNPFGLERTLTTGIVSSLNRSLKLHGNRTIKQIIQIDAAINPGNSGGPLLDAHGRLIGINAAIATTSGQSAGVGFAIPASLVARVVPQLLKFGRVIRPEVGILKVFETEKGLLIAQLQPNGPAEKAGLKGPKVIRSRRGPFVVEKLDRSAADLIVGIDDEKVKTADEFLGYIEERKPGDEIVLVVMRDNRKVNVPVKLTSTDGQAEK